MVDSESEAEVKEFEKQMDVHYRKLLTPEQYEKFRQTMEVVKKRLSTIKTTNLYHTQLTTEEKTLAYIGEMASKALGYQSFSIRTEDNKIYPIKKRNKRLKRKTEE